MALNRATRELVDVDGQIDSTYSAYSSTDVMVEQVGDGTNVRHVIWQIDTGAALDPNSVTTYNAAPTGSQFISNAGTPYKKTGATTWAAV